jgi:hypothetical protein
MSPVRRRCRVLGVAAGLDQAQITQAEPPTSSSPAPPLAPLPGLDPSPEVVEIKVTARARRQADVYLAVSGHLRERDREAPHQRPAETGEPVHHRRRDRLATAGIKVLCGGPDPIRCEGPRL